ncbi:hypothetical protein D3C80_1875460 [compost metagenome]
MLPLESLEMGIPCLTSNNHHYFQNSKLHEFLVVNENDNAMEIYKKIKYCLDHKEEVMNLYREWKNEYNKEVLNNNKKIFD